MPEPVQRRRPMLPAVFLAAIAAMLCGCSAFADYEYDLLIENGSASPISVEVKEAGRSLGTIPGCTAGHRTFMAGGAGYPVTVSLEVAQDGQIVETLLASFAEPEEGYNPVAMVQYRPERPDCCSTPVVDRLQVHVRNSGTQGTLLVRIGQAATPVLSPGDTHVIEGIAGTPQEALEGMDLSVADASGEVLTVWDDYELFVDLPDYALGAVPVVEVDVQRRHEASER